jgi:hypothetical protein
LVEFSSFIYLKYYYYYKGVQGVLTTLKNVDNLA